VIGDPGNHIAHVTLGVDAVHLGGFSEGVHGGSASAAGIGTSKQIVLDCVVGHLQASVGSVAGQSGPARQRVADCLGERTLAADRSASR
jgi:hypothetical protein